MSKYKYPPSSDDTTKINQLLQVYKTVIDGYAFYISTPMTSGLLYMQAFASLSESDKEGGITEEHKNSLFNINCKHASSVAAITRNRYPHSIVVDPTKIEIKGWEQNDYLTFWHQVIEDNVSMIIFVNDWYYSNGCAYEFLVGVTSNKVMVDEFEAIISPSKGRKLIQKAYDEHLKNQYDNEFLKDIIKALDKHIEKELLYNGSKIN